MGGKECRGKKTGAERRRGRRKTKGWESRKREWKLQGIREQQEARDTNVAQLKKAEVRKMAEDGCRGAQGRKQGMEWETRGGPDTGRTRDGR